MKGLITKLFTVFLISVFAITYSSASTVPQIKKPSIVFLSPEFPESDFFHTVTKIMQAAASSLGVSLEVVYGNDNPVNILEQGTQIINRKNKADYLVMVNDISSTPVLMKLAHDQGQKTFYLMGLSKPNCMIDIMQKIQLHGLGVCCLMTNNQVISWLRCW
ncbi:hypothetical protein [uncultured Cocleimonas sp.]|uniref:hypothetical protein n=1 Tax=uncultured Cocleimonas sp. TaxID=1051587 RepID=UPI00260A194C|nr:hypothetical protein [uncultured Cocleimonas sp.]